MRTIKDPVERKTEIMDAAQELFMAKGYANTTINDVLHATGIAKGTFYYYFKSKEEVLDAILQRIITEDVARTAKVAKNNALLPQEKILQVMLAQRPNQGDAKEKMLEQFHRPGNAEMHQKSIMLGIRYLAPVIAKIVQEGVESGVFNTQYPLEVAEFSLAASSFIFDDSLAEWTPEGQQKKAFAFVDIMEKAVGAQPGTLSSILTLLL